jgi:parvulin-like peptidyl-prolyl isomerase
MNNEDKKELTADESPKTNDSIDVVSSKKKKSTTKLIFASLIGLLIIVVIGVALIAWNMFGDKDISVASVNNESITQTALDNFILQQEAGYQSQGLDISDPEQLKEAKKQALETLVNQALLLQAATDDGVIITDEEINNGYDSTVAQFESDEALQTALVESNLTIELLKENILTQLTIQKYLEPRVDENVTISEEEIQNLYDQYVADGSNIPALEEVTTQLSDQIKQQKMDSQVGDIIGILRETAEIELYLE